MKKFLDFLTENKNSDAMQSRIQILASEIEMTFSEDNIKKYPKILASFKNLEVIKDNKDVQLQLTTWLEAQHKVIDKILSNIESNTKIAKDFIENN